MLAQQGYRVFLYDGNMSLDLSGFAKEAGEGRVVPITGAFPEGLAKAVSACVISPGIPLRLPFVKTLQSAGIPIVSELQAAFTFAKGRTAKGAG